MRNLSKKATHKNKVIRNCYCNHSRNNYIKFIKKFNVKKLRRFFKEIDSQDNVIIENN